MQHHWGVHQFIGKCLIPLDPWVTSSLKNSKKFVIPKQNSQITFGKVDFTLLVYFYVHYLTVNRLDTKEKNIDIKISQKIFCRFKSVVETLKQRF